MSKAICKQSAEVALPFDNIRDFLEVDVFESMFVRLTFDGLDEDDRGFGEMMFFKRQSINRPSPTGYYAGKCILVELRVVGNRNKFNSRCRETMQQLDVFLLLFSFLGRSPEALNEAGKPLLPAAQRYSSCCDRSESMPVLSSTKYAVPLSFPKAT